MEGFNLYREAKSDYERLIPDKLKGLILLSLYSQFGESEFKEEDITLSINNVFGDLGKSSERTEYERNNRIIIDFQNNFLWRDLIKYTYRFRPYGLEFCKAIHQRLENSYNPAKIKRSFDELLNQLKILLEEDRLNGFFFWIEDHFTLRKEFLGQQIESLDEQVNRSVEEFKKHLKTD